MECSHNVGDCESLPNCCRNEEIQLRGGISETHWTQVGQQRLASGVLLLYSSHEEENVPHTQGVALMLSKQAQNALIGWESHGHRIIKASFETNEEGISMNVIQCYVPTNDYNENAKDQFYDRLQSIIEKCPTKDLTILMGESNAKVGMNNTGYEDIMEGHGLGERNENATPPHILAHNVCSCRIRFKES
ncbi:unnamed protein product [Schistosoma margrebowiei]|uniref:Uncharacterized protein n=1 Tax=Schistosoma margrebowiei TaxID=48269 RepID=A0A183N3I8_9TREM|nr:unnamed protein product [Schistosoma margrebowiei]